MPLTHSLIKNGAPTGWAVYNDSAGDQTLAADTRVLYTVDGLSGLSDQLPIGVDDLWTGNKITGRFGDALNIKIQCVATPSDSVASKIDFEIDIAGAVGVVERQTEPLILGALMEHAVTFSFPAYTYDTWEANGGEIYVTADGPVVLSDKRVLIVRTHKGR